MNSYRLAEIAEQLGLTLQGDGNTEITGIASLEHASKGEISFLADKKLAKSLQTTKASAVIVQELPADDTTDSSISWLLSSNPYLSFAHLTALFNDAPKYQASVHPSALIDASATIGKNVVIGANVMIGAHSVIGDNCIIETNTVISERCVLGDDCHLHANVTLYHNVIVGNQVIIHSGAVLGADGFGFAPQSGQYKWQKIYQLGGVRIGNRVEIGANSCIDRGALADTIVHDGVIIDNLVHIAHNCEVGDNSALAAYVGVAGSVKIGKNCTFAGKVGISGHLEIADNCHFAGMTVVTGTVKEPGAYATGTAMMPVREWRKSAVRFSQLDDMYARLRKLEKILANQSSLPE
jgi:UDP-3-O-[3-hydroxymyristoyl] glucosamine N-acyltransferase